MGTKTETNVTYYSDGTPPLTETYEVYVDPVATGTANFKANTQRQIKRELSRGNVAAALLLSAKLGA